MQELEKIFKEIDETIERYKENPRLEIVDICYGLNQAKRIIRNHMNEGWIPVEQRLPEAGEHVLASFKSDGFLPATAIISENGRWSMLQGAKGFDDVTEDVIAWRPLPEPYRPKKESEGSRRLREREEFFKE